MKDDMATSGSYDAWIGHDAYDSQGNKLGAIDDIFYDDVTQRPEWVAVKTGMFGSKRSFAPIAGATLMDEGGKGDEGDQCLRLAVTEAQIRDAPRCEAGDDQHLSADEERALYSHYGFDYGTTGKEAGYGYGQSYATGERVDRDYQTGWRDEWMSKTQGRDDSGDVVATETVKDQQAVIQEQPKQVRLRKYQWTEQVPVEREEVRMEQVDTSRSTETASGRQQRRS